MNGQEEAEKRASTTSLRAYLLKTPYSPIQILHLLHLTQVTNLLHRHITRMTRLLTFTIISLLLAAGATALPQPATTVRVNDMVVLDDGTAGLQVDPVGGFNDTTRDPAWQSAYVESLKRSHLLDKTVYERRSVSHQPDDDDDDDDGGDENYGGFPLLPLLSKRQNRPEACVWMPTFITLPYLTLPTYPYRPALHCHITLDTLNKLTPVRAARMHGRADSLGGVGHQDRGLRRVRLRLRGHGVPDDP